MQKFKNLLLLILIGYQVSTSAQIGTINYVGNVTMGINAGSPTRTELQIANNSGGHDKITVSGNLTLTGVLQIILDGYTPNLADTFVIATYTGTLSNTFTIIQWPTGMTSGWSIDYGVLRPGKVTIFGSQSPLPVELIEFRGASMERGNELSWMTASEVNADNFGIEHSQDGRSWKQVGQLRAKGHSSVMQNYTFLHTDLTTPVNYYRLKQVDFDGRSDVSYAITVNRQVEEAAIQFYPNPTSGLIQFRGVVNHVRVHDVAGKTLIETSKISSNLDVSHLPTGTYYLYINHSAKAEVITINK